MTTSTTTSPAPLTLGGRQARLQPPTVPPAATRPVRLRPHLLRRHHWVTVAARRLTGTEHDWAAAPTTQLLQGCARDCGRHRVTHLPGHWPARALIHPTTRAAA